MQRPPPLFPLPGGGRALHPEGMQASNAYNTPRRGSSQPVQQGAPGLYGIADGQNNPDLIQLVIAPPNCSNLLYTSPDKYKNNFA